MTQEFVIDQVGWHTQADNIETREHVLRRFAILARFLDDHGLTRSPVATRAIDDAFAIRSTDLTEDGLQLMRAAYDAWLRGIDRGRSPEDVRSLEKALRKLRKG